MLRHEKSTHTEIAFFAEKAIKCRTHIVKGTIFPFILTRHSNYFFHYHHSAHTKQKLGVYSKNSKWGGDEPQTWGLSRSGKWGFASNGKWGRCERVGMTLIIPARAIRQSAYSSRKFTDAATNVASRYGKGALRKRGHQDGFGVDSSVFLYTKHLV